MRRAQQSTIYDALRIETGRNGAIKSPSPQSEQPIAEASFYAAMESSGIGEAGAGGWPSRHYAGGALTPQVYTRPPANGEDRLEDAGRAMNTRAAHPSRGMAPRSPVLGRR